MPLLFAADSVQLMAGGEQQALPPCFVFHARITHSSLCLIWWVPWCLEFQHKNLENIIKKYWFSFMFPTHLMQGKTSHCSSHISPSVSAHAKSPLGQFQKKLVLGRN